MQNVLIGDSSRRVGIISGWGLLWLVLLAPLDAVPAADLVHRLAEAWRWRVFDRSEGLNSNNVTALFQDSDKFLYAATDQGVCAYDLWLWHVLENPPPRPSAESEPFAPGEITAFAESLNVVYGATSRALWKIRGGRNIERVLTGDGLTLAATDREESFVIVDEGHRRHLRIRGENISPVDGDGVEARLPVGPILGYQVDTRQRHWLLTGVGLYSRELRERRWKEVEDRELTDSLIGWECLNLYRAGPVQPPVPGAIRPPPEGGSRGELWAVFRGPAASDRRLVMARWRRERWEETATVPGAVVPTAIVRDAAGHYYLTSEQGRLFVSSDGATWKLVETLGLGGVTLFGGVVDTAGVVWFRIGAGGIAAFDPLSRRWERISGGGAPVQNVLSLTQTSDHEIWVGTKSGVSRYVAGQDPVRYTEVLGEPLRRVTGLAQDPRKGVWISSGSRASFRGALYFDGETWWKDDTPGFRDHHFRRIVRDRRDELWFLGQPRDAQGSTKMYRLSVFTSFRLVEVPVDLPSAGLNDLLRTQDDVYWIATTDGLLQGRLRDTGASHDTGGLRGTGRVGQVRFVTENTYRESDGLRSRNVWDVAEGPDGAIWVCYPNSAGGVTRLYNGDVKTFFESDGLASSIVWSITPALGFLWLGTDRGVTRYDGECFYSFPVAQAESHWSYVWPISQARDDPGSLMIGTAGLGVWRFRMTDSRRPVFTETIFPGHVREGASVTFQWDARDHRNTTEPSELRFRSRLGGEAWTRFSAERSRTIANLPTGNYTFEVEVRDIDGNRNREKLVHRFYVGTLNETLVTRWVVAGLGGAAACVIAVVVIRRQIRARRQFGLYEAFFREYPAAILCVDQKGTVVEYNGAHAEILGLGADGAARAIGSRVELLPSLAGGKVGSGLRATLEKGQRFLLDNHRWSPAPGDERILAVRGLPILNLRGRVKGAVVIVQDCTVDAKAGRLHERGRRLSSLQNLAERMARGVHGVLGETSSADEETGGIDSELLARLGYTSEVATSLHAFAGRLAGKLATKRISMQAALESLLADTRDGDDARRWKTTSAVRIDYVTPVGLWDVIADAEKLERALIELLRNAVEAMRDSGTLTVRARNVRLEGDSGLLPDGPFVELSLRDTGPGMDAVQLERVLEPFYSTKASDGALGMGLSYAYGVIRAHGGDIRLESTPGYGTVVRIWVPAVK